MDVSIILPCYNSIKLLEKAVKRTKEVMNKTNYKYEIILAEDGSLDGTYHLAKRLVETEKNVILIHDDLRLGRGKGVSNAILKSKGKIVGFLDVDLGTPAFYIPRFIFEIENGADIACALRVYQLSLNDLFRWVLSKGYSFISRFLLKTNLKDTEAGCKFFNRERIIPILSEIKDNHWFWDTEIMVRAYYKNYKIVEVQSLFYRYTDEGTTVNILKDSFSYFLKLLNFSKEIKRVQKKDQHF